VNTKRRMRRKKRGGWVNGANKLLVGMPHEFERRVTQHRGRKLRGYATHELSRVIRSRRNCVANPAYGLFSERTARQKVFLITHETQPRLLRRATI
jgi:predicted GIY-YIG superfamily endonuclease